MLKRKKIIKFWIFVMTVLCCSFFEVTANAEDSWPEILVVVDKSKSLKEEEGAVNQSLNFLYSWLEKDLCSSSDVVIFSDEAVLTDIKNLETVELNRNVTSIFSGLNKADEWIEKRLETDSNVCVVFISDLIESQKDAYSMTAAKKEQENINAVIQKWEEYEEEKKLNYLFLTWPDENIKTLDQLNEEMEIQEFRCSITDLDNVYWIQSNLEGEAVSQIEMTGLMLTKILQVMTETDLNVREKGYLQNNEIFEIEECCKTYMLMDRNVGIMDVESNNDIVPVCDTGSLQLFAMGMDMIGKSVQIKSGKDLCESYCFYIPPIEAEVYFSDYYVESDVTVFCNIKSNYHKRLLVEPLQITIWGEEGREKAFVCKEDMLLNEDGVYEYDVSFGKTDYYTCQIQMSNGLIIKEIDIGKAKVDEKDSDVVPVNCTTVIQREEPNKVLIISICVIIVLFVTGTVIFLRRR